jgi:hypothetical protein
MDNYERRKKSDKAKEKFERNGGYSQKHVRLQEAAAEKRTSVGQSQSQGQKAAKGSKN